MRNAGTEWGSVAFFAGRIPERDGRQAFLVLQERGLLHRRGHFPESATGEIGWRVYSDTAVGAIDLLINGLNEKSVLAAVHATSSAYDATLALIPNELRTVSGSLPLACKPTCSHCCHIRVTTLAPYVLHLAEYIRKRKSKAFVARLLERIQRYREELGELQGLERIRYLSACPLLVDDLCSVYPVRPPACRGCHSFDVQECEKDERLDGVRSQIPLSPLRQMVHAAATAGLEDVLRVHRLDLRELEFVPALEIALRDGTALARWIEGEEVFESAYNPDLVAAGRAYLSGPNA